MIIRFKLFEWTSDDSDAEELVDQFDSDFIDEYFKSNYSIDVGEIAKYHHDIWQFVDDDRFVKDWIDGEIQNQTIRDISDEYEMKIFIKEELIDNKSVEKFLKKKRKKYQLEKSDSYEDVVDELDEKDLQRLIVKEKSNDEFVKWYVNRRYSGMDAQDILTELYGEKDLKENAYQYVENYVDDSDIEEDYYENESSEYKKDWVKDQISTEQDLQNKLIEIDSKNTILLLTVMSDNTSKCIGDEYDYQNAFMEEAIKQTKEEDFDELYPAEKLKELNTKFGLADGIKEKYKEYTYYIDVDRYNV